jgi:hypothetical protein
MEMTDETKNKDDRVNDILFGPLERPALAWFCEHMPRWVTPDHLRPVRPHVRKEFNHRPIHQAKRNQL